MCPLFPLLFPRAPWVVGEVQLCGHSTRYLSPMVYSHMTAILFPNILLPCLLSIICAPYQQCSSGFSLFSLILMASLSAKCCCSTTRSAPATSPKPVYSCITRLLSNSVKGYMLCIFYTTAVSGTLLPVPDPNMIHCFHQQPLAQTVRTPHLHKPVVWILTDPNF